jgi:hypothetical protein
MPAKDREIESKGLETLKQELLSKLATKEELKKLDDRFAGIFIRMQEKIEAMETKEEADRKFNILMNATDHLTSLVENQSTEKAAIDHGLTRHKNRLDEHERRIVELESVK